MAICYGTILADHRALQHRVHHGHYTQPSHVRVERDHGSAEENEVIDEEPNGKIDFSQAVPQKDGSLCVTKVKYMEKLEKTQVQIKYLQNDGKSCNCNIIDNETCFSITLYFSS